MKAQEIILNEERNVTLTAYVQDAEGEFGFAKRPAMLVIPGGGYAMCSDREADPVAMAYLKAGYQAFVLRYTCTPRGKWPLPLEDYEQSMTLIEDNAEEWHLDKTKIAVVGFSAGGHLAACAATVAEHKPAAAVLVYPAILKDICDLCQPGMPYPHEHVTSDTCPCFLVAARDDRTVDISNTLRMELALTENTGEDWINTNSVCPRLPHWVPDSIEWLGEIMGRLTRGGFTEPVRAGSMNGNFAPVLSVDCTLSHLRKQSAEAKAVLAPMYAAIEAVAKARQFSVEGLMAAVGNNTAREIMEMVQIPSDTITEIDKALHQMLNQLED